MKPIIIYQPKNKDGKIVLSPAEFEKYLEDAYNQGYTDGYSKGFGDGSSASPITTPANPINPINPLNPWVNPLTNPWVTTTGTTGECIVTNGESSDQSTQITLKQ